MTQLPRDRERERERERAARESVHRQYHSSFFLPILIYFVGFFRLSFFLFPSFLLNFEFCVLSTVNFSVYDKSLFAFVMHIQANFKVHASAMLGTGLLQAIGLLCELLTYMYLQRHTHTSVQTHVHKSIGRYAHT